MLREKLINAFYSLSLEKGIWKAIFYIHILQYCYSWVFVAAICFFLLIWLYIHILYGGRTETMIRIQVGASFKSTANFRSCAPNQHRNHWKGCFQAPVKFMTIILLTSVSLKLSSPPPQKKHQALYISGCWRVLIDTTYLQASSISDLRQRA